MASITAHPIIRTRGAAPVPVVPAPVAIEDDHRPSNSVPGPDERTLARTTAAVVTSLVLLIGTVAMVAAGAGAVVRGIVGWFMG